MIYFVSNQITAFTEFKQITVEESLTLIKSWGNLLQYDSETDGLDCHINRLLCIQIGSCKSDEQIVIDAQTIDITQYKEILESNVLFGHNLKFDLKFLYNYGIVPLTVYDTMIIEQLLHLGWPSNAISYSLQETAYRYMDIWLDKSVRRNIIWKGLVEEVIFYAANDVKYIYQIFEYQYKLLKQNTLVKAAAVENSFVPVIAYLEWCGIHLDETKWRAKMANDQKNLIEKRQLLNDFVIKCSENNSKFPFVHINYQGDLFEGFNTQPVCIINWSSSRQVVQFAKYLGFDTTTQDKQTGEDKDSVLEKHLKGQKGINDEFLKLYFDYKEFEKVCSSFGQGHLDAINPITDRIHTEYKQLGAASGRMSCGSSSCNEDLAKYKKIPTKRCSYVNIQQLPHDAVTRACFTAPKGYKAVSCDWSAAEARLAGDIYNDQAIKDIFLNGIDSHSMYAKIFFKEELKDIDVNDVKRLRPDLRQLAKGPEFALNFGGGKIAIMQAIQCTEEVADNIIKNYEEGFKGTAEFAKKGEKFVKQNGYVLMCEATGHKMYWYDWKAWYDRQKSFTSEFWEEYRTEHKPKNDAIAQMVKMHFKAASKWSRMARNAPTQGERYAPCLNSVNSVNPEMGIPSQALW